MGKIGAEDFTEEIEKVKQIPIINTLLEVICQSTGMGFATIAKVTRDRWIAYSVLDKIAFGLQAGGELKVETTICNTVRDEEREIVIDNVDEDPDFRDHMTPKMYGFKSYISYPIFLKNGGFFGTLCAIDPKPAELKNEKIVGMFRLFADLISFHFDGLEIVGRSKIALKHVRSELALSKEEIAKYHHLSNHELQEPLRKIRIFSNMLLTEIEKPNLEKAKDLAKKVNRHAEGVSALIKDIAYFSELDLMSPDFSDVNLTAVANSAIDQLDSEVRKARIKIECGMLPTIKGKVFQIEQLFYYLIQSLLKLPVTIPEPVISISETDAAISETEEDRYFDISLRFTCGKLEISRLQNLADGLTSMGRSTDNAEINMAYCRKIVLNHGGKISISSEDRCVTFLISLPGYLITRAQVPS